MVTGRRAFEAKSKASLIAAIVDRDPPPIASLQPLTPPALERVIKTCLQKDPDDRWQTAHDVTVQLEWIEKAGSDAAVTVPVIVRRKRRELVAWTLAAVSIAAAIAGWTIAMRELREPAPIIRSSIGAPEKTTFAFDRGPMAISPDGTKVVFVARSGEGTPLWVRPLNSERAASLPGTNDAHFPFWSPDSRFIGFFARGKLMKIDASGGPPQTLADAPLPRGGTWNRDGVILFVPMTFAPVHRVSAAGGAVTRVSELGKYASHRFPTFLPDGRRFLFLAQTHAAGVAHSGDAIMVGSIDSPDPPKLLLHASSNPQYVPPGYLLYYRDQTLMAQRLDLDAMEVRGDPIPIANPVQFLPNTGSAMFSASNTGTLVYQAGAEGGLSQLIWFDRSGKQLGAVGTMNDYQRPRVSPDGRRIAVDVIDPRSGNYDIYIHDVARETATRFTFDPAIDINPIWSPDGSRIIFNSSRKAAAELYEKVTTGGGTEQLLHACPSFCVPISWSRDGRFLSFQINDPTTKWDMWIWSMNEKKASPLLRTDFNEMAPAISPDGRWVVYHSDETGQNEVYVQSFPSAAGRWQVP